MKAFILTLSLFVVFGFSALELTNGVYYSTEKAVEKFELSNCCAEGPISCKMRYIQKSNNSDRTFKKSSFVKGLFYDPNANGNHYLFMDKENNLIYGFLTPELYDKDTKYTIKFIYILSTDESIKSKNPQSVRPQVEAVLKELYDKKRADQNKEAQQKLQSIYLPKAGMTNVALQNKILSELNKVSEEKKWGDSFKKVIITSTDWYIVKNQYTSAIIKRVIDVVAIMTNETNSPGKCFFVEHKFSQQYAGKGYAEALTYEGIGATNEILCDRTK